MDSDSHCNNQDEVEDTPKSKEKTYKSLKKNLNSKIKTSNPVVISDIKNTFSITNSYRLGDFSALSSKDTACSTMAPISTNNDYNKEIISTLRKDSDLDRDNNLSLSYDNNDIHYLKENTSYLDIVDCLQADSRLHEYHDIIGDLALYSKEDSLFHHHHKDYYEEDFLKHKRGYEDLLTPSKCDIQEEQKFLFKKPSSKKE